MIKVFDCSNSEECQQVRGYGGPRENTCVATVKKYAYDFGVEFTTNINDAHVLFTNDIFPSKYINISLPKVKRMDGVFWQESLLSRNIPYNAAAQLADHVIFISKYSCNQFFQRYHTPIQSFSIVTNWIDSEIFHTQHKLVNSRIECWCASATDWTREEKRLSTLINFAKMIPSTVQLSLIGTVAKSCIETLPYNIVILGYLNQKQICKYLSNCDAFINVSYRDAAPKCVAEAVSCGLPILYTDSGGVPELVQIGVRVPDYESYFQEENHTPKLFIRPEYIQNLEDNFIYLRDAALEASKQSSIFMYNMVEEYCWAFKKV